MRWFYLVVMFTVALSIGYGGERTTPIFVSTQWLADHLNDPDIVVLQVAFNRGQYSVGHVPGARFLWFNWLAISTPDASTEMPPLEQADTLLEGFGVTKDSKIILCFMGSSVSATTRMFLALSYFGLGDQVSILDGGYDAWKSEDRPVSKEFPHVKRTSLALTPVESVITTADWIRTNLSNPHVAIIDARDKTFYDGKGGGALRTGHITGAKNITFSTILDTLNKIKDLDTLQKAFDNAGITKDMKVVSYCHTGQQATVIYTAAKLLGYDAAVYDGSFEDWNVRGDEYPVEKPSLPAEKKE